jgi:hypothetical protein
MEVLRELRETLDYDARDVPLRGSLFFHEIPFHVIRSHEP